MPRTALFGVLALAVLASPRAVAEETPSDLTGVYACEGMNPDGTPYGGVVEIVKFNDAYLVRWTMFDDTQVVGVGLVRTGMLAVSYFAGTPAVAVYSTGKEGRLDGKWTIGGAEGAVFSETLTKVAVRPSLPIKRQAASRSGVSA